MPDDRAPLKGGKRAIQYAMACERLACDERVAFMVPTDEAGADLVAFVASHLPPDAWSGLTVHVLRDGEISDAR